VTEYVALIDGERGAYGAVVPDLPGCTSAANTFKTLRLNIIEAVRLWIEHATTNGEEVPTARSPEELRRDPEVAAALGRGAALTLVPVLRDDGHPKKANISTTMGLLEAIDDAAEEHGLTRSNFLATAAREKPQEQLRKQPEELERVLRLATDAATKRAAETSAEKPAAKRKRSSSRKKA